MSTHSSTLAYPTQSSLSEKVRAQVVDLANHALAAAIDLQLSCKQAHWNVKGPQFMSLHKMFDELTEDVEEYVDLLAERVVALGGIAEGTLASVSSQTVLDPYPLRIASGHDHCEAIAKSLAAFGRLVRGDIDRATALEDAATADLFTEITRGVDKWLWFVEAHLQA